MVWLLLLACAEPDASVHIVSPADGDTVCGTPLAVDVEVEGLTLVDPEAATEEPGTGHLDVMLNGQDAAMGGAEHVEIADVADGPWQLKVELSNADHTPVVPYAGEFVYITVEASRCGS